MWPLGTYVYDTLVVKMYTLRRIPVEEKLPKMKQWEKNNIDDRRNKPFYYLDYTIINNIYRCCSTRGLTIF